MGEAFLRELRVDALEPILCDGFQCGGVAQLFADFGKDGVGKRRGADRNAARLARPRKRLDIRHIAELPKRSTVPRKRHTTFRTPPNIFAENTRRL